MDQPSLAILREATEAILMVAVAEVALDKHIVNVISLRDIVQFDFHGATANLFKYLYMYMHIYVCSNLILTTDVRALCDSFAFVKLICDSCFLQKRNTSLSLM